MRALDVRSDEKLLFIGDSITDAGRRGAERPYGNGYVSLFIELQQAMSPQVQINYVNKGIGGNTVFDLRNRWDDDMVREQPDWLSVMIGINDMHRWLAGNETHSVERFREDYDAILAVTCEKTKARVLLIDPFYISTDQTGLGARSRVLEHLPHYTAVVQEMARKHRTRHLRTHGMFQRQLKYVAPEFFCAEPVHPYRSGHLCIALEVMKALSAGGTEG